MKSARIALLALCLSIGFADRASAQTVDSQDFAERVHTIVPLGYVATDRQIFAGLNVRQKRDLVACRDVLIGLLKSLETGGNALQYLAPDLARQFKTTADVAASLMPPETTLMASGISGFAFPEDSAGVQLRFFVLAFSDGKLVVSEQAVVLEKTKGQWRVAGFE